MTPTCLQVISKEANFVTVRLHSTNEPPTGTLVRTDLLCSVRALLKKIKQTVLVGDNVQVASIDWADKRGTLHRKFSGLLCKPSVNILITAYICLCSYKSSPHIRLSGEVVCLTAHTSM